MKEWMNAPASEQQWDIYCSFIKFIKAVSWDSKLTPILIIFYEILGFILEVDINNKYLSLFLEREISKKNLRISFIVLVRSDPDKICPDLKDLPRLRVRL